MDKTLLLNTASCPNFYANARTLAGFLKKAQEQLPTADAEALLSAHLAPDMFPLSTQIRFACVQAQEAVYRLKAKPFPPTVEETLNEGQNAGEHPRSLSNALARIDETIALLESLTAGALDANPDSLIAHKLPNGIIFDLTAEQFARDWTLPQFYFHLMAAYAILRNNKVELGKADYVAHVFAYLRPGTMPKG
jgi:hypothetical protein